MDYPIWVCAECLTTVYPPDWTATEYFDRCPVCGAYHGQPSEPEPEPDADDNTWLEYKIDGGEPNPDYVPPKRKRK